MTTALWWAAMAMWIIGFALTYWQQTRRIWSPAIYLVGSGVLTASIVTDDRVTGAHMWGSLALVTACEAGLVWAIASHFTRTRKESRRAQQEVE